MFGWNEAVDQLNAAQTGALVANLMHEVKGDALSWTFIMFVSYITFIQITSSLK